MMSSTLLPTGDMRRTQLDQRLDRPHAREKGYLEGANGSLEFLGASWISSRMDEHPGI